MLLDQIEHWFIDNRVTLISNQIHAFSPLFKIYAYYSVYSFNMSQKSIAFHNPITIVQNIIVTLSGLRHHRHINMFYQVAKFWSAVAFKYTNASTFLEIQMPLLFLMINFLMAYTHGAEQFLYYIWNRFLLIIRRMVWDSNNPTSLAGCWAWKMHMDNLQMIIISYWLWKSALDFLQIIIKK